MLYTSSSTSAISWKKWLRKNLQAEGSVGGLGTAACANRPSSNREEHHLIIELPQHCVEWCRATERTQKSDDVPKDPIERDVLACKIIGQDALPHAICELYEANPSRDLWKGMLQEWLRQVSSRASGAFGHYYMKCCLDRLFSVRQMCHGTISWWPTECPAYKKWYRILYPHQRLDDDSKFQILCAIYLKLNTIATSGNCSFPNALAQTCWDLKEKDGRLALTC